MEYAVRKNRLYQGGKEVLRYRIEYPVFCEYPKISVLLEKIADNCEEYCVGTLFSGGGRSIYEMKVRVLHHGGGALSLLIRAELVKNEEEKAFARGVTFDTKTELMMPPRLIIRRFGKRGVKYPKKGDIILIDGDIQSL